MSATRLSPRSPSCACTRRRALGMIAGGLAAPLLGGCDRIASWVVSDAAVEELGNEAWARLKATKPAIPDGGAQRTVEAVTTRLLAAAGEDPAGWEVRVFADPTLNAFAMPGRKIGVFAGMLNVARSQDALAAVIGHEIGHIRAEHPAERITGEMARQWGLQLIYLFLEIGDIGFAREIAGLLGVGAEFGLVRPYGRRQEREADRIGVFLMADAGFDPRAAVTLWQGMADLQQAQTPAFLSTHPSPASRARDIQAMIPEALQAART